MTEDYKWETTIIADGIVYQERDGETRSQPLDRLAELRPAREDGDNDADPVGTQYRITIKAFQEGDKP